MSIACHLEQRIDAIMKDYIPENGPGVALLIGRDQEVLLRKAYGMANVANQEKLTPGHQFLIASISKQFMGMAIMLLKRQGLLDYDEPIERFFPDFPDYKMQVTIRHLLTHTSGIEEYLTEEFWNEMVKGEGSFTQETLIERIKGFPSLEFQPGERWRYCNSAYVMLGHIIEVASGQGLAEFVKTHIFEPLGMKSSVVGETGERQPLQAMGYQKAKEDDAYSEAPFTREVVGWADGNIISTVDDLFIWGQALYTDKLLPLEELATSFVPWKACDPTMTRYGFGQVMGERRGCREIHHSGGTLGFVSRFSRFTDEKLTIILLSNGSNMSMENIMGAIALDLLETKMTPICPVSLPQGQLQEKVGIYKGKPRGAEMALQVEYEENEGVLRATLRTGEQTLSQGPLTPLTRHVFLYQELPDTYVSFEWDAKDGAHARIRSVGLVMNFSRQLS